MARWDDAEWYRSSKWSPEIAQAFEARLARARAWNRPQYLRIQGLHLIAQDDPMLQHRGRHLLQRVVDEYGDSSEATVALENLADALVKVGDRDGAERAYRGVLRRFSEQAWGRSGTSGATEVALAELLVARGDHASLHEADQLLDAVDLAPLAPVLRDLLLRYLVVRARVARARGDLERASAFAKAGLEVAAEAVPAMPRHPEIGRPRVSRKLTTELREIAGQR